jgi:hypothetical protein
MQTADFLAKILPDTGNICVTTIQGKTVIPFFADDIPEAVDHIKANSNTKGVNVYYAMATFENAGSRKQDNVKLIKSFWLDLDCGFGTAYRTPQDGLKALNDFVAVSGLPAPLVVCSGGGLHVYWPLTEPITKAQWQPIASKLPTLCANTQLPIKDPGCSVDSVRILRVINTMNYKNPETPTRVEVMQDGETVSYEVFLQAFNLACGDGKGASLVPAATPPAIVSLVPYSESMDILARPITASFKKIIEGQRCPQLMGAYLDRATLSEPRWRGALSVAQCCTDRIRAITFVSKGHPDFDMDKAIAKAELTKGPYKCETFKLNYPEGCQGCTAKVTSPIQLGEELVEATSNLITAVTEVEDENGELVSEIAEYEVTPYPFPYRRGVNGGIYTEGTPSADGSPGRLECVYEHDIYALRRYHDQIEGESILGRLHLPHDGMREFVIPLKTVLTPEKLRDALAMQGVAVSKRNMDRIMHMMMLQVQGLQKASSAKVARRQFGWHDRDSCFVAGDREIRANEIVYSPPSTATVNMIAAMQERGTLEGWKKVVNVLDTPGFELQAFAFLCGLASPLLQYTGQKGFFISLVSEQSGTGKTTTLQMINSIWGHPDELMIQENDTNNSKIFRCGVHGNIALCIDEITNMAPEDMSALVYAITHGRDKNRMMANVTQERVNNSTWSLSGFTSANSTMRDKISSIKATSEGENMRFFEFYISKAGSFTKAQADTLFRPLAHNFGHAGPIFIQFILNNYEKVMQLLRAEQQKFDELFGSSSKERMWSAQYAVAFTAAKVARAAGIFDFDIPRIREAAMAAMISQRSEVSEVVENSDDTLGNFLAANMSNIVIVDEASNATLNLDSQPHNRSAMHKIVARHEINTKTLYISQSAFREYCTKRQISYRMAVENLRKQTFFVGIANKRLGTGLGMILPAIRVIHLEGDFDFAPK